MEPLEPRRLLSGFSPNVDNPFFPLVPGVSFVYRGENEDGQSLRVRTTVDEQTQVIAGVAARVVRSTEWRDGQLVERTREYFAQSANGDVWYFGEDSEEIEDDGDGEIISRAGSWRAKARGAQPGIIMRGQHAIGDEYRQEFLPGEAEDQATVLGFVASRNAPFGRFSGVLQIEETTPIDPEVLEHKFYAAGVGMIAAVDIQGGEVLRLAHVYVDPSAVERVLANPELQLIPNADELRAARRPQVNVAPTARPFATTSRIAAKIEEQPAVLA
jgi:hypothetical protein